MRISTHTFTSLRTLIALFLVAMSGCVWAGTATDVLTPSVIGVSSSSYGDFSNKTATSDAVYAGNSQATTDGEGFKIRTTNSNSGIITTMSGGIAKSVVVTWLSSNSSNRTIYIYGKNSAYSSAADLFNSSKRGTKLGEIKYGTSTELTISSSYTYIGICSADGTAYLADISITWEKDSYVDPSSKTPTTTTFPQATYTVYRGDFFTAPQATVSVEGAALTYTSSEETVAEVDPSTGAVSIKGIGETIITAAYAGDDDYAASEGSYTLTVTAHSVAWIPDYADGTKLNDVNVGTTPTITLTFSTGDGDASLQPRFQTENGVNLYVGNTISVSVPKGYMLCGAAFDFVSNRSYSFTVDVGTFTSTSGKGTWTGLASQVTLANNKDALMANITSITISYIALTERASVSLGTDGIGTFCSDEPVIIDDGSLSYVVTGVDGNNMLIEESLPIIPANTGVLLHGTEGNHTVYTCDGLADYATEPATNWLVGVTTDTPAIVDTYVLQKNHGVVAFYHVETAGITTVTAGKVYLDPPDGISLAKALLFTSPDEVDAITAPKGREEVPVAVYTLSGQKVTRLHRGINIVRLPDGTIVKRLQR